VVIEIFSRLTHDPASVPEARAALSPLESAVDPSTFETLRLLVSELVTQRVRHGRGWASDELELAVTASRERIRVEVSDYWPGPPGRFGDEGPYRGSGWTFQLVEAFSDRWGSDSNGKARVWCELLDSGAFPVEDARC
jgi:Histidine kinase-like ATPase domain